MFSKHMPVQQCDDGVSPSTGVNSLSHFLEYGWVNSRAEGKSPHFESQVLQNDKAPVGIPFWKELSSVSGIGVGACLTSALSLWNFTCGLSSKVAGEYQ